MEDKLLWAGRFQTSLQSEVKEGRRRETERWDEEGGEGAEGGEERIGLLGRFNPDRGWGRNIWKYPEEGDVANSWSSQSCPEAEPPPVASALSSSHLALSGLRRKGALQSNTGVTLLT